MTTPLTTSQCAELARYLSRVLSITEANAQEMVKQFNGGLGEQSKHMAPDENDECGDHESCDKCGGDGTIMLSEAGPGVWGEDCFCDVDRVITCPVCEGKS